MNTRNITTALALLLFTATASAETYKDTGEWTFIGVNNAYRAYTGVAVPNIVPGDEVLIVCDGQFTMTTPGETVLMSSRALASDADSITAVATTVLPTSSARVSYDTRYWPVNRTGIWVSPAFYTDVIFSCEYRARSSVKDLANLGARTVMWVSRRAP